MSTPAKKIVQKLYYFKKPSRWDKGVGACIPEAYRKFWKEWKYQKPTAVHYIEKPGVFERNERTGEVRPIQNVPLPLKYPPELHDGIWGGEAVVQGFIKKSKFRRRVSHFWVPHLQRSILYSEVLDTYMRAVVTRRAFKLINENYGFDHYLLKTPACDLQSLLALSIKRKILIALADKTLYPDDPVKREEVYARYQAYLAAYTREEIEWYGLSWKQAREKYMEISRAKAEIKPLKLQYRSELIAQLKAEKIREAEGVEMPDAESKSWITKINPFAKNPKAQ